MAPTIVLRDEKPVLVIGSPGGSRIVGYVARVVIAHLDWRMDIQKAVAVPTSSTASVPWTSRRACLPR